MSERTPLLRDQTRLKTVHRQRVLRQGEAEPAPAFELERYSPSVLEVGRTSWQCLLETEHESVVIAGWMTSALARMGAPLDIVGAFGRVVEDEVRHVDITAQVIESLGGKPEVPHTATPPFPSWGADQVAEEEVVMGLVAFFCVGEELSRLVYRQAMELAQEPLSQWAISEIHRDEAFHGAFGYETAELYVPKFNSDARRRLVERVQLELGRLERRLGGPLPPGAAPPKVTADMEALARLGLPPTPLLLKVFYEGVEREVVPRFKKLGIDIDVRVSRG